MYNKDVLLLKTAWVVPIQFSTSWFIFHSKKKTNGRYFPLRCQLLLMRAASPEEGEIQGGESAFNISDKESLQVPENEPKEKAQSLFKYTDFTDIGGGSRTPRPSSSGATPSGSRGLEKTKEKGSTPPPRMGATQGTPAGFDPTKTTPPFTAGSYDVGLSTTGGKTSNTSFVDFVKQITKSKQTFNAPEGTVLVVTFYVTDTLMFSNTALTLYSVVPPLGRTKTPTELPATSTDSYISSPNETLTVTLYFVILSAASNFDWKDLALFFHQTVLLEFYQQFVPPTVILEQIKLTLLDDQRNELGSYVYNSNLAGVCKAGDGIPSPKSWSFSVIPGGLDGVRRNEFLMFFPKINFHHQITIHEPGNPLLQASFALSQKLAGELTVKGEEREGRNKVLSTDVLKLRMLVKTRRRSAVHDFYPVMDVFPNKFVTGRNYSTNYVEHIYQNSRNAIIPASTVDLGGSSVTRTDAATAAEPGVKQMDGTTNVTSTAFGPHSRATTVVASGLPADKLETQTKRMLEGPPEEPNTQTADGGSPTT